MEKKLSKEEEMKMLEDQRRAEKIERELKNKKRPWFIRQWLHRNILQWANLVFGLIFGTYVMLQPTIFGKPWDWTDMIIMAACGMNFTIWLWGGMFNRQQDLLDELLELNSRILKMAGGLIERVRYGRPYID